MTRFTFLFELKKLKSKFLHLRYFWGLVLFQILHLTLPHTWLSSSLEDRKLFASSECNDSLELKDKTVRSVTV